MMSHSTQELPNLTGGPTDAVPNANDEPFLASEAQKQLRDSEVEQRHLFENQQAILNALPSHIALLDEKGVILAVNEAWRRFAGESGFQSADAGLGLNYLDVCTRAGAHGAKEAEQTARGILQVLRGELAQFELEYPCEAPQGSRWFHLTVTPTGSLARPTGAVVSHQNITASKLAELERQRTTDALRLSEATMAEAQRISHFGSWELDLDDRDNLSANPLRWSDETYRIAGLEPGSVEVTNDLFFSIVPKEDHAMITEAVAATLRDGGQYAVTHRMVRPDGEVRVVHEMGKLFVDEATGQPSKMIGTVHDITEQRRAEESLRRSEQEQRELVRRLEQEQARLTVAQRVGKVGSWELELATLAVSWSAETFRIFETDPAAFQPDHANIIGSIHPEDRETANLAFQESLEHGELCTLEHRLLLTGGRIKHVEERWQIFFDDNGAPLRAIGTIQDITERRQVSEEIEQTAALLRAVADGTPDAIFVKDLEGRYQFFNEGAARHVGIEVEQVLGKDDTALFPPEDVRIIQENDRRALASEKALAQEELVTIEGVTHTYLATKAPYHDSSGRVIGLIGISRDITDRKQQERRLSVLSRLGRELNTATSPRRAAEIIVAAADELFGWDASSLDLYSEERDEITTVLNVDTIDGLRDECSPAYDMEQPSGLARSVITSGARLILRSSPQPPDPASRMFGDVARSSASLMFVPVRNSDKVVGLISIQSYRVNAYTEADLKVLELLADYCAGALNRIQTEFLREVSEQRFREMAENVGDVFYNYAPEDNRLLYTNEAFARLWGRPLEELYENPQTYLQQIHPDDRPVVDAALQEQLDGLKTEVEFRILRPDGSLCWVRQSAVPIQDGAQNVERIVGTMRDITERRLNADRLAEQAALLDKAHDAIVVRDLNDGSVLFWNKSAERLYGWTKEEALGRQAEELLYKDQPHFTAATATTLAEGEWNGELVKMTKAGKSVTIECHWSLVRDDQGRPKSILMIDTDVTERVIIEQQYLRAQRMESIGTLAGGIAHDLNNVLAPILMSIELLRLKEKDPMRLNVLTTIEQSAKRGADMVQQVLSFARGVEGRQLAVDVGRLVTEIQKIANETFLKNIQVEADVREGLWIVQGDPTQLHQVLLNLCVNARDAMPDGGRLTLSACNLMLDEQYAGMNIEARPGPHVCIRVEDTGSGMPPGVVERIFEPFFTTKELGKGTGLGLSTTLAIVKSHGGFVRVYSEPGRGSRFHLYFPALTEASEYGQPPTLTDLPRGSGQLVLLIDDEPSVRQITSQTLEAFGYRVVLATDGADATSIFARRMQEIDVVLTDMMMPIMDGPATIQVLLRMQPKIRIIAASGLNANAMVAKAMSAGVAHFIPKPYTAETLLKTLRQALAAPRE